MMLILKLMVRFSLLIRNYPIASAAIISLILLVLPVIAWAQVYEAQLKNPDIYTVYPLFGLVAFTMMFGHVLTATLARLVHVELVEFKAYYRATGLVVLACLLLHPGLFVWQLHRDGYGLPPFSYLEFVGPDQRIFVLMSSIAFVIFLLFELKRWFGGRSWWHIVERSSDAAMILIFFHALFLSTQTQLAWFRVVWVVYGILLGSCLVYAYLQRHRENRT